MVDVIGTVPSGLETKVYDLTGMILEKKFDLVEQLLNMNPSLETVRGLESVPKGLEPVPKGLEPVPKGLEPVPKGLEQANMKRENQMSPIDAVYLLMLEEHFKVVNGKSDLLTLKQLFSIARLLLEKGVKIKGTCEAMLYLAIRYKEETLRWLLKASLFSREFLEADLEIHMNEVNEINNVLQVKAKLEKLDHN